MMTITYFLAILAGAYLMRLRGRDKDDGAFGIPKQVRVASMCLLAGAALWMASGTAWAVIAGLSMWPGLLIGHGSYFPFGTDRWNGRPDNELFADMLNWMDFEDDGNWWRCFTGMLLTAMVSTVPAALAMMIMDGWGWWALILAAIGKPLCYAGSHVIEEAGIPRGATDMAEWGWGGALIAVSAFPAL